MFRRFEPLIAEGLRNFPSATKFTPGPDIGLTTFTARFRDAVTSFRRYGWSSNLIDSAKFHAESGRFVIKYDQENSCCWFCNRMAAGRAPAGVSVDSASIPDSNAVRPSGILSDLTENELKAFILLLHTGRLIGPVLVTGKLSSEQTDPYVALNVAFAYDPSSNITTIL